MAALSRVLGIRYNSALRCGEAGGIEGPRRSSSGAEVSGPRRNPTSESKMATNQVCFDVSEVTMT